MQMKCQTSRVAILDHTVGLYGGMTIASHADGRNIEIR